MKARKLLGNWEKESDKDNGEKCLFASTGNHKVYAHIYPSVFYPGKTYFYVRIGSKKANGYRRCVYLAKLAVEEYLSKHGCL